MSNKFMRILVFFDLPVVKKKERKIYSQFRRFLLNDGYDMIQYSVYSRLCNGTDMTNKHLKRLNTILPEKGSVRCLTITEKQYEEMKFLVGKSSVKEKRVNCNQLSLF
jgi:CRISPR-associated protein Cas2